MNNAARIVYRTQSVILQSSVEQEISFAQFREATITAASNIFGNNSYEVAQVTNAWYAVGVGDKYQYRHGHRPVHQSGKNGTSRILYEKTARAHIRFDCRSATQIGERRVGKECRSRWSPYH